MAENTRRKDDEFPMLMDKISAKEFIGVDDLDSLIKYEGLDKAVFKPRGRKSALFNKLIMNEWLGRGCK